MTFSKRISATPVSDCEIKENSQEAISNSGDNRRQIPPIKATFLALGIYARDNPGHRRQVGLVISSMKDLARCPESSGLRRLAAAHAARLAELRQSMVVEVIQSARNGQAAACERRPILICNGELITWRRAMNKPTDAIDVARAIYGLSYVEMMEFARTLGDTVRGRIEDGEDEDYWERDRLADVLRWWAECRIDSTESE